MSIFSKTAPLIDTAPLVVWPDQAKDCAPDSPIGQAYRRFIGVQDIASDLQAQIRVWQRRLEEMERIIYGATPATADFGPIAAATAEQRVLERAIAAHERRAGEVAPRLELARTQLASEWDAVWAKRQQLSTNRGEHGESLQQDERGALACSVNYLTGVTATRP